MHVEKIWELLKLYYLGFLTYFWFFFCRAHAPSFAPKSNLKFPVCCLGDIPGDPFNLFKDNIHTCTHSWI